MRFFLDLFSINLAYASVVDDFLLKASTSVINPLITLIFALAVVYFLYGVLEFVLNQENEEKKTTGKGHMLWGVVGIAIMMAVWTILSIINISSDIKISPEGRTEVKLTPINP